ncbi:MAG: M14 family zinc carboxypeptidase [Phocaeicola sp.]
MNKKLYLFLASILFSTLAAQDLKKVQQKFFPNPTQWETKSPIGSKSTGYTSFKEMKSYLFELQKANQEIMEVEEVGKTQREREILLVKLSNKQAATTKMRVLYMARIHGDEPAGTEGLLHFIEKVTSDPTMKTLLERIDFYILPMVNADGAQRMTRQTANGIDLNRDQVRLETPEAVALRKVVNQADPHVCIDFHEYQPLKSAYSLLSSEVLSLPWDVMFLTSGNPNVASPIRASVESLFIANVKQVLKENNHSSHTYYTPKKTSSGVVMNLGGTSPRSTTNSLALNNAFTILTETRGIGLGRAGINRRIQNVYLLAQSFAHTTYNNNEQLLEAIHAASKEVKPVAIEFSSERIEEYPLPFVNQLKNRLDTLNLTVSNAMKSEIKQARELPTKYFILPTEKRAIETLHKMGIETIQLAEAMDVEVEVFKVTKQEEEQISFATFTPIKVTTTLQKKSIQLPIGTHIVRTNQKRGRLVAVMLEPESSNGFVNYKIIEAQEGEQLPVFRFMN